MEESEASQRTKPETIDIPEEELQEALRIGQTYLDKWNQLEVDVSRQIHNLTKGYGTRYMPEAIAQSKEAAVYLVARKHLNQK